MLRGFEIGIGMFYFKDSLRRTSNDIHTVSIYVNSLFFLSFTLLSAADKDSFNCVVSR
jgi:hypothetical protein